MTNLIDAHGLVKRYGNATVLDNVSLCVPAGCVTGFIGANGAGKTTTIRALLGLMELDGGKAMLFGEPFGPHADDARAHRLKQRIGVVFDTCPFIGDLPVRAAGTIMKASFPTWKQGRFEDLLSQFDLDPKKKIKDLSRGMGMKLQLACALAHDPDLLVLDEATAGLDPMARDEILDLLRAFMEDERRGILISSHITTDLQKIADRIVCIDRGRIVFDMEKDLITDMAGVAHCRTTEFERVRESQLFGQGRLRWIRQPMSVDVLVPDRFEFAKLFPHVACDRASIDDYLQLTLKGETR